jgi:hypothetical protein
MKLTAKAVDALMLGSENDLFAWDTELIGFGIRVRRHPDGKVYKVYVVQWKSGRTSKRLLIGSANVLTAAQARAHAKKLLARIALGRDPQEERGERLAQIAGLQQMERRIRQLERLVNNFEGAINGQRRRKREDDQAMAILRAGENKPDGGACSHRVRKDRHRHHEG